MALMISDNGGGDFELCPADVHDARCWLVCDLGLQEGGQWGPKAKIQIGWEIPGARMKDGRCFSVFERYTASLSERSQLRPMLEAWRGRPFTPDELKGFNVGQLLDKCCQVLVQHRAYKGRDGKERKAANVTAVMPIKGRTLPPMENTPILFDLAKPDNLNDLPDWLRKRINIPDGTFANGPPPHSDDDVPTFDDDIDDIPPF